MEQIALALVAAFAAAFVRGLSGFGMAILIVPVLGLTISPQSAVITSNILGFLIGLVGLKKIVADSENSAGPIALLAVVATPPGLWLLSVTDPAVARLSIAIVALLAFGLLLLPKRANTYRASVWETGMTGITSGLLTGFAGMPGPPVVPYYLRRTIMPQVARASMMAIFMATSLAGILASFALGLMTSREPLLAAILFPAILLGNTVGARAFGKISDPAWRTFTGVVLGVAAAGAMVKLFN